MDNPPDLAELGVTLTGLIALIDGSGGGDEDALARLPAAVAIGEQLGELGDHLVGHFVDQARQEGASWTAIGTSMGVTKQAAQKKFVPGPGDAPAGRLLNRFTPRASKAVEVAQKAARRMKNRGVGTEHLVLGLVATGGVAAEVMHAQGVSAGEIRKAVHAAAAPSTDELPDPIPFAPATKRALEMAAREALRRGHNYIGTEHLLLAVLADPESVGSRVLTSLGITARETSERIDQMLAQLVATEPF